MLPALLRLPTAPPQVMAGSAPHTPGLFVFLHLSTMKNSAFSPPADTPTPYLLVVLNDVNDALTWFYEAEPQLAGEYFGVALKQRMENAIASVVPSQHDTAVVVEVTDGVAEITTCPDNIEVKIIDHDNP